MKISKKTAIEFVRNHFLAIDKQACPECKKVLWRMVFKDGTSICSECQAISFYRQKRIVKLYEIAVIDAKLKRLEAANNADILHPALLERWTPMPTKLKAVKPKKKVLA